MVKEDRASWKSKFFIRIIKLFDEYPKVFIVGVDNVGSKQMQQIRAALRGHAVVLMGKNTMMRKAIRGHLDNNPQLEKMLNYIKGNVGFVFTKEDLTDIRDKITENRVPAAAKAGTIAQCDVTVPAQNTGMGPEKTSFFQALAIPTKISRGTIEILNDVPLIKEGDKVGASEAALLQMLNITPFSYGLQLEHVYENGSVFLPSVLDITDDQIRGYLMEGLSKVAALSLAINYPNTASISHMIVNGFKKLLAIAAETDITFAEAEQMKEYLKDPSKFVADVGGVAAGAGGEPEGAAEAVEEKEAEKPAESSEESSDEGGFGDLFG